MSILRYKITVSFDHRCLVILGWSAACDYFKVGQVDIWVNNAGVFGEKEGWERAMDINLTAVVRGSSMAIAKMAKRNGGKN